MSEGGNVRFQGMQCPFPGVLVLSTEIVDGRPRLLQLRRSSASWKTAQSVLHISQCDEKLSGLSTEQEAQLSPRDRAMRRVS